MKKKRELVRKTKIPMPHSNSNLIGTAKRV